MQRMSIRKMENLALCPSLTEVDLSYNRIVRIEGLDTLDELKRLVRPPQSPHPNQG